MDSAATTSAAANSRYEASTSHSDLKRELEEVVVRLPIRKTLFRLAMPSSPGATTSIVRHRTGVTRDGRITATEFQTARFAAALDAAPELGEVAQHAGQIQLLEGADLQGNDAQHDVEEAALANGGQGHFRSALRFRHGPFEQGNDLGTQRAPLALGAALLVLDALFGHSHKTSGT